MSHVFFDRGDVALPDGIAAVDDEPDPALGTAMPPFRGVAAAVRRAPLLSFLVLSCLLSWWPAVLYLLGRSPVPIAGFGPFLAAVCVLAATEGRAGVRRLLSAMVRWRVPARGYLAAVGLPVLVTGTAILVTLALGATTPSSTDLALWTNVPATMLLVLLVPGLGGAWEEPGFRGFALGRFERRFGRSAGPLVLGAFWVLWHAPLFMTGQILWTDVLEIVAASVVIAAVFHFARDSVLIAMLLHSTNNAVGGEFASQLFDGADKVTLGLVTAAAWWLLAGGILFLGGSSRRRETKRGGATQAGRELPRPAANRTRHDSMDAGRRRRVTATAVERSAHVTARLPRADRGDPAHPFRGGRRCRALARLLHRRARR